jgi:hypothetical protein
MTKYDYFRSKEEKQIRQKFGKRAAWKAVITH